MQIEELKIMIADLIIDNADLRKKIAEQSQQTEVLKREIKNLEERVQKDKS